MATKRRKKKPTRTTAPKKASRPPATLARAKPTAPAPRTDADWRTFIDDVVDETNRRIRHAGLEHEAAADLLFKALYGSDVDAALDPENNPTEAFQRVGERAGASLRLQFAEFVAYIRIGAMNQLRRDDAWLGMDWSKKQLLVALLALPNGRELMKHGIELAGQPNVGVAHLRSWVYDQIPKKPGTVGRPRSEGFTLTAGSRLAQAGVKLKSERQRRAFIKQLEKAPPERREELVKDLRDALEGLQALVEELGELDP